MLIEKNPKKLPALVFAGHSEQPRKQIVAALGMANCAELGG